MAEALPLPQGGELVGVAVDHDAGERFVLDSDGKLYRLEDEAPVLVFDGSDRLDDVGQARVYTDVVSLGGHRFALTAENVGFLLDLNLATFEPYFCYLPSVDPDQMPSTDAQLSLSQQFELAGVPTAQRTNAVGYNAALGALFAQPQTFTADWATLVGSEVFMFDLLGGDPVAWLQVDDEFIAGGMVARDDGSLVFGRGRELLRQLPGSQPEAMSSFTNLAGAVDIQGMAVDLDGSWLLLDGTGRRLFSVAASDG